MQKIFILLLLAAAQNVMAQNFVSNQRPSKGTERIAAFNQHQAAINLSAYKKLQWRNVGPDNISGRCTDVWGISGNKNIVYAAFATGGLWKTEIGRAHV